MSVFVRIVSLNDPEWVELFEAQLMGNHGGRPTSQAHTFEMPAGFPWRDFFGLEVAPIPAGHEPASLEVQWLLNYDGTFPFYLDLKRQFLERGALSVNQMAAITRAMERDKPKRVEPQDFTYPPGSVLLLKRWGASILAQNTGLVRPHFVVEVLETLAETPKAIHLKLQLSAQRTSHCGICGLFLSNPHSVDAGVGPICAGNLGISYGEKSLEELAEKLKVAGEVQTWLPIGAIKTRLR